MEIIFMYLLFMFIGIFFIWAQFSTHEACQQKIKAYLQNKNFTNIDIEKIWFDGDRDTSTYNVAYTDEQGRRHHTSCKIRDRLWESEIEIYWKHQP